MWYSKLKGILDVIYDLKYFSDNDLIILGLSQKNI